MSNELIPIIAAYWGQPSSFEVPLIDTTTRIPKTIDAGCLSELLNPWREQQGGSNLFDFKIHLRPLWSITEAELMEVGKVANVEKTTVSILIGGYCAVKIINYLRSKSFCVDQELIDNDLVQWV